MDKQSNTVAANKVSWECLQKIANGIIFNIFLLNTECIYASYLFLMRQL